MTAVKRSQIHRVGPYWRRAQQAVLSSLKLKQTDSCNLLPYFIPLLTRHETYHITSQRIALSHRSALTDQAVDHGCENQSALAPLRFFVLRRNATFQSVEAAIKRRQSLL